MNADTLSRLCYFHNISSDTILYGIRSVSYTHLDVYKRQPYNVVSNYFFNFFYYFLSINVVLAVFNLLPIPPLDGSKILGSLLPDKCFRFILTIERYGFLILLVLVLFGLTEKILMPPVNFIINLLLQITFVS